MSTVDEAMRITRYLSIELGTRTIGSENCKAAARFIQQHFQDSGLAIQCQEFDCPDWVEESTFVKLGDETLEASANTFSPSCNLTASTISAGTQAELENADIRGKVLILYGSLAQSELAAKAAIYVSPRDRRIHQILEERQPAALITINPGLHGRWRLIEDFDLNLPSVTVSAAAGLKLLRQTGSPVSISIASKRSPSNSANVVGTLTGSIPDKIVLCAHYDTKVDTPGAYDNATGVGVLLALASHFARVPHRHKFEFVAFSGEEIYGLGDMTYARLTANRFEEITAAVNFDGVGPFTGSTSLAIFAASEKFAQLAAEKAARFPAVAQVDPWPASDHYIFYSNGVPSMAFSSVGIRDIYHTPDDTFDWISQQKLAETMDLALEIILEVDGKDRLWTRQKDSS